MLDLFFSQPSFRNAA